MIGSVRMTTMIGSVSQDVLVRMMTMIGSVSQDDDDWQW